VSAPFQHCALRTPDAAAIHIGFVGLDVAAHVLALQRAHGKELALLGAMPGMSADVHQFDHLFEPRGGGWYALTPALWSFISQHTQTTRHFRRLPRP